jgi:hypothetical protein
METFLKKRKKNIFARRRKRGKEEINIKEEIVNFFLRMTLV